ncbi:MAG: hypothetical protein C4524_00670 [Candidatus Zixiibacteriota bacterium]|nr:MAG: hypothetical protein C4524_00670 [candidate division Zixibacteria bacterium]
MKTTIVALSVLAILSPAWGQTGYNARSMGLAGAYQGLALGPETARWNPANLGLPGHPETCVELPSLAISLGNNALSLGLYNTYFSQDYFDENEQWDAAAKDEILGAIPASGFQGFNRLQLTALGVSWKRYALSMNTFAYCDLHLPFNLFAVPLQGLGLDPVELTDVSGEAVAGTEFALSGAYPLNLGWDKVQDFSVGATVKILAGHAYARMLDTGGRLLSNEDSISIDGYYRAILAGLPADGGSTGWGYGLDLGAAARLNEEWSVGLTLSNILGSLRFNGLEEAQGSFSFHQPGLNQDEFGSFQEYLDSVTVESDTTFATDGGVTWNPPRAAVLSATWRPSPRLALEADYHQGLNTTTGGSTTPRLALGAETRYYNFLPVRFGLALGGVQGTTLAMGLGVEWGSYRLDLAAAGQRGLFNGSKGVNYALSQRLIF